MIVLVGVVVALVLLDARLRARRDRAARAAPRDEALITTQELTVDLSRRH